ncbi:MAG: hypothetical protein ACFFC0_08235, partial [Promethearchaeota archaeon]
MNTRRSALVFSVAIIVGLLLTSNTYPLQIESMRPGPVFPTDYESLASSDEQYVDNNISNVDGVGDKGTHSNFGGQKDGPDATYDTLSEENTEPIATNAEDDYDSYAGDA